MGKKSANASMLKAAKTNVKVIKSENESKRDMISRLLSEQPQKKTVKKSRIKLEDPEINESVDSEKRNDEKDAFIGKWKAKTDQEYCTIEQFERDVYVMDGIKIIIRGPKYTRVMKYPYKKKAANNTKLTDFLIRRIYRTLQHDYQVEVIYPKRDSTTTMKDVRKYISDNRLLVE